MKATNTDCGYMRTDMTTSVACKDAQGNITGYVYKRVYKRGGRLYICHRGAFILLDTIFQSGTDFFNA